MIETLTVNNTPVDISIGAETITLPDEGAGWLFTTRQLTTSKKKYHLAAEGFLFLDEGKGVSIAAQLVRWIHSDIVVGQHTVLLPLDQSVYTATIQVRKDYLLVEDEDIISFEDALAIVRADPGACQVGKLGALSDAFEQHSVALTDLQINLTPTANPYSLKRGYTLGELGLFTLTSVAAAYVLMALLTSTPTELKQITDTLRTRTAPSAAVLQIDDDLATLDTTLGAFAVLFNYNLHSLQIVRNGQGYDTIAEGYYDQSISLARLHTIATALNGKLGVQDTTWTLRSSFHQPPRGETAPLVPLTTSFEAYRRTATALHARFAILGVTQTPEMATGTVELSLARPNSAVLKHAAQRLATARLPGQLQKADLTVQSHAAWHRLTFTVEIKGT